MNDISRLTELFKELGAEDPKGWARAHVEQGGTELARFLFLRQAWRYIVPEDDASWIDGEISRAEAGPDEPYAGVGHALASLRAKGATDEELTDLVRGKQAQMLFNFCYLLDDPGDVEESVSDIEWILIQVDQEGKVIGPINSLHDSVLGTDPTGREMRPKGASLE